MCQATRISRSGFSALISRSALRRGLDRDEAPVLEPHGVAVVERRRLVEVEQEVEPALAFQRDAAPVPALMIEGDGVGDALGLHGGFADDGGGAEHSSFSLR